MLSKQFLKLTNRIVNTNYIKEIIIKPDEYHINLLNTDISGFMLFSIGSIHQNIYQINIYKEDNEEDYNTVTEWISKLEKN